MTNRLLRYVLGYAVLGGAAAALVAYAVGAYAGVPIPLVGLGLLFSGWTVGPLLLGTTDTGIETASGGAVIGFGAGNPADHQPDAIPVPNRAGVGLLFVGLGFAGLVGAATYVA